MNDIDLSTVGFMGSMLMFRGSNPEPLNLTPPFHLLCCPKIPKPTLKADLAFRF